MRALVGPTEIAAFENPSGNFAFPYLDGSAYRSVFDFGCGCGRVARQMMQQREEPRHYLGVDLHAGMINWCQTNLTPNRPNYRFLHHDVFDESFNPAGDKARVLPLPARDREYTLFNAISVFTHLTEDQVPHYLSEAARILADDGVIHASFFLLEKCEFPFMQAHANALYVSWQFPTAAVIFDRSWLLERARAAGLTVAAVHPPPIRGYQWIIEMRHSQEGLDEVELPPDLAPLGEVTIPPMPVDASQIGL
jgi:SAM-dependent methyltransferase